jgi:hypothetical protein
MFMEVLLQVWQDDLWHIQLDSSLSAAVSARTDTIRLLVLPCTFKSISLMGSSSGQDNKQ